MKMEKSEEDIYNQNEASPVRDTANGICRIVADVVMAHGVVDVVCSPGSRNAPLLVAMSSRSELRKHVVIDERAAAFTALGMALVSRRPVALVCTSGTALLNYAPAVAEAFYQGIPLIVISADRPEPWIDQDDSQTLRQNGTLSNYVKGSYDLHALSVPDREQAWYANRVANDAMIQAMSSRRGPVHINVRLAPPLGAVEMVTPHRERTIDLLQGDASLDRTQMARLAQRAASHRILVVAGFMSPSSRLNKAMVAMDAMPNVHVMAETISNLHLSAENYCVDSLLALCDNEELKQFSPDIVITLGGALVSRMVKEYLRKSDVKEHWAVGYQHTTVDCFQHLTLRIEADATDFMTQLAGRMRRVISRNNNITRSVTEFRSFWHSKAVAALERSREFARSVPWTDFRAFALILDSIPASANLFLSNGTSVRYAQILSWHVPHASYCNRGVSGIDGGTSTAIGGSAGYKGGITLLLTGDMSFAYDIGSLQMGMAAERMRIIVVNNSGGGIFRFIESTRRLDELETYFCAAPGLDLGTLAKGFGWGYHRVCDEQDLSECIRDFLSPEGGRRILEVVTPPEESAGWLRKYLNIQ